MLEVHLFLFSVWDQNAVGKVYPWSDEYLKSRSRKEGRGLSALRSKSGNRKPNVNICLWSPGWVKPWTRLYCPQRGKKRQVFAGVCCSPHSSAWLQQQLCKCSRTCRGFCICKLNAPGGFSKHSKNIIWIIAMKKFGISDGLYVSISFPGFLLFSFLLMCIGEEISKWSHCMHHVFLHTLFLKRYVRVFF